MTIENYSGVKEASVQMDSDTGKATLRILTGSGDQNAIHGIDVDGTICLLKAISHIARRFNLDIAALTTTR